MPPLGRLIGHVDFSNLFINLSETHYETIAAAKAAGAATLNYGLFLNTVINFLIVAFAVFLLVRQVNRLAPKPAPAAPAPALRDCPYCLSAVPAQATRCAHCTSELRPA
jgi:large conductance mechanosensitive channel